MRNDGRMRIALGSDHAGYELKRHLVGYLTTTGHTVLDCGTDSTESVDYPAFCAAAARKVSAGDADRAMVFGGSGQGEQIVANKIQGIRAALCHNVTMAELSRQHNDANVLAMGGRMVSTWMAEQIVAVWLASDFDGGRHQARIDQITEIDNR